MACGGSLGKTSHVSLVEFQVSSQQICFSIKEQRHTTAARLVPVAVLGSSAGTALNSPQQAYP